MTPKTGKVFKGQQFIADVRYERWERADRTQSGLPGLAQPCVINRIFWRPADAQMSDGWKQDFFLEDANGLCKGTGGPY